MRFKMLPKWDFETFKYSLMGWGGSYPIKDVGDRTWALRIGKKTHYLARSSQRPAKLVSFMALVEDFYIVKFGKYYCYWTSEPKTSFFPCTDGIRLAKTLPPFKMEDYKKYLDEIRRKGR